jgi:hypothetical protein
VRASCCYGLLSGPWSGATGLTSKRAVGRHPPPCTSCRHVVKRFSNRLNVRSSSSSSPPSARHNRRASPPSHARFHNTTTIMSAAAAPLTSSPGARLLRRPTQSRHRARLARSSTTVQSSAASTDVTIVDRVKLGTSEIMVGATGVGAWAWGDRSGYWGGENAETAKDNLAAYRTLLKGGVDFVDVSDRLSILLLYLLRICL